MLYLNLVVLTYYYYHHNFPTVADKTQWGMLVTNVEQGKNNTFTFPIAFKNNLYFYWAFDYAGYFYNLIIKTKILILVIFMEHILMEQNKQGS